MVWTFPQQTPDPSTQSQRDLPHRYHASIAYRRSSTKHPASQHVASAQRGRPAHPATCNPSSSKNSSPKLPIRSHACRVALPSAADRSPITSRVRPSKGLFNVVTCLRSYTCASQRITLPFKQGSVSAMNALPCAEVSVSALPEPPVREVRRVKVRRSGLHC